MRGVAGRFSARARARSAGAEHVSAGGRGAPQEREMAAVAGLYGLGDDQRARHRRGQANAERSESRDDNTEA